MSSDTQEGREHPYYLGNIINPTSLFTLVVVHIRRYLFYYTTALGMGLRHSHNDDIGEFVVNTLELPEGQHLGLEGAVGENLVGLRVITSLSTT